MGFELGTFGLQQRSESDTLATAPARHFRHFFYLKQGEMSVSHYQAAAEQLIERMIPQYNASKTMKHTDVKQLLLRNLLLVGLRHKDVLKQCQTMKSDACTAEHLLNLARQAEYRDTTALRLTKTVTSNAHTLQDNSESSLHKINQRRQKIDQQNGSSNSRRSDMSNFRQLADFSLFCLVLGHSCESSRSGLIFTSVGGGGGSV